MEMTAIVKKGEKQYIALCPEIDVVSEGKTVEESIKNLKEAIELHIEVMGLEKGVATKKTVIKTIGVCYEPKTSEIIW